MAIIVNGSALRTLSQPIYVNGSQIKAGYFDGTLCYPEDLPQGAYVLQLSGSMAQSFQARVCTKFGSWSWWSGFGDTTFSMGHFSMTGQVTTTIVSKKPIAVFDARIPINTSDLSSKYHAGTAYKYGATIWGGGNNQTPNGTVSRFPTLHASVGYQLCYGSSTSHEGDSISGCAADSHTCYAIWGFNTYRMQDYEDGSAALTCLRKDSLRTDMAWYVAQNKEYVNGYHAVTTGPEYGLSTSRITYTGGFVDTVDGYPDWKYFLSVCGRPSRQVVRADGTAYVDSSLSLVDSSAICGYRLNVRIPAILGDMGSSGSPAKGNETSYTLPICWVPFTRVDYNNNPPISSPTFSTDPPTSEASDDLRTQIEIVHHGL